MLFQIKKVNLVIYPFFYGVNFILLLNLLFELEENIIQRNF